MANHRDCHAKQISKVKWERKGGKVIPQLSPAEDAKLPGESRHRIGEEKSHPSAKRFPGRSNKDTPWRVQ